MSLDLSYEPGPDVDVVRSEPHKHRVLETWRMEGSAGDPVTIDAHLPATPQRIIVMAHGADNSRMARYIEVAGKSFTRHGTAVVAMDAPGHGDRPGAAPLDLLPGLYPGMLEEWVRDHRLLLDVIEDRWPATPIGFVGFSMGGLFGVPLLAVDQRLRAGVFVLAGSTRVSYESRLDLDDASLGVLDVTDPAVHAPAVGERPVLILDAADDEIVPRVAGLALYDAFTGPKEMVFMPGTHTEWDHAARWFRRIESFIVDALG